MIQDLNPKSLRLAIGADHGGFELKGKLAAKLAEGAWRCVYCEQKV